MARDPDGGRRVRPAITGTVDGSHGDPDCLLPAPSVRSCRCNSTRSPGPEARGTNSRGTGRPSTITVKPSVPAGPSSAGRNPGDQSLARWQKPGSGLEPQADRRLAVRRRSSGPGSIVK